MQQAANPPALAQALALEIKSAQDHAQPLALLSTRHPELSLADAYAVAQRLQQMRMSAGAVTVGRKIGFTNPQLWDQYGVRLPIWGAMYAHTVLPYEQWQAGFSLQPFVQPKIEPEVVLHFDRAPPSGADAAAVLACVDWVAHGFEIVQSHYANWKFTAADAVADGSLHGALLLGTPQPVSQLGGDLLGRLKQLKLDLFCDAAFVQSGLGSNVMGSPLMAVAHLLEVLAAQGPACALRAGEMVTTGTITAAYAVQAGQTWHTQIEGLGLPGLRVEFKE
jgi:2-keto-4-pentenoate hydratase